MDKILVVNMNYLGDALMTTPAHAVLRRAFPEAHIDAIAGSSPAEILAMNPDIDRIIPRVAGDAAARCRQLFGVLRKGRYDAVVILPTIPVYSAIAKLARTPIRVMSPTLQGRCHMADHLLKTVLPLAAGAEPSRRYVLEVPDVAVRTAGHLLSHLPHPGAPIVAVNMGATRPQKRWPLGHFSQLICRLVRDKNVVLLGGTAASDLEGAVQVRRSVGDEGVTDLTGRTSIAELAAVIAASDVLVTADTVAMHIASAVGTPQVAVFGSTDPQITGPYGQSPARIIYKKLACAPCGKHPTCGGRYDCLASIRPDEVLEALESLLRSEHRIPVAVSAGVAQT